MTCALVFFRGLYRYFFGTFCWCFNLSSRVRRSQSRSKSARSPVIPKGWLSSSVPNPSALPKHLLTPKERHFVARLMPNVFGSRQPIFDKESLSFLLHAFWNEHLCNVSDDSLFRNLYSNECYADRQYTTARDGSIRVFRLGLVCGVPMPCDRAKYELWYCYPRSSYHLSWMNFSRPFPPHDVLSNWCYKAFGEGLSEGVLNPAEKRLRKIPLWHGEGEYIADNCYRLTLDGKSEYIWFEIHTGAEGYDEEYYIPRLISAEKELQGRGRYVIIVPFKRDVDTARRAIRAYNHKAETEESKPSIDLQLTDIISYQGIKHYKEKLGIHEHYTRV